MGWNAVILYRILLLCFVIIVQIGLIAIDASPLVVAMFLSLTALVAGVWMAYLHSRFLMAVTPVVVSVLMATLAMKMLSRDSLFLPAKRLVPFVIVRLDTVLLLLELLA